MRASLGALLVAASASAFAQEHKHGATPAAAHDHAATPTVAAPVHDHGAMATDVPAATPQFADAVHLNLLEHGGMLNYLLLGERFEQQSVDGEDGFLWEAQGWYGGDYRKLWVKTAGNYSRSSSEIQHSELQLLFSKAAAPFWDLQLGLRHDESDHASRDYAVLGVMGLAPYWFELDAAAFVSDKGDVSTRVEAEYELRFTQKLLLQPRLELNHAFSEDHDAGSDQGLFDSSIGFRLRYEFIREFAPYIGMEWKVGGSDDDQDESRIVAGLRFWY